MSAEYHEAAVRRANYDMLPDDGVFGVDNTKVGGYQTGVAFQNSQAGKNQPGHLAR